MKNRLFLYKFKSLLLIILVLLTTISSFPYRVSAASVKYQVADAAIDKLIDETIYSVAKQTGYKIATQEQIDTMRASFKKQFPDWDFTTAGDINYNDYPNIAKYDRESKEVIIKLDNDMRNWVNTYITGLPRTETLETSTTNIEQGQNYKVSSDTASLIIYQVFDGNKFKIGEYGVSSGIRYYISNTQQYIDSTGCKGTSLYATLYGPNFSIYKTVMVAVSLNSAPGGDYPDCPFTIDFDEIDASGNKIGTHTQETNIDHTADFTNFVPYPTKQSELTDTTKLPMELRVPATTDSDNIITPTVSPLPFPSVTQSPDTDGKVKVGDSTIVYQKPTVDPSTGTIVDPVTTPDTNTVPNTDDTTGQTPDSTNYTVPTTTPKLDFSPLMSATMKFPFCIPWDLWDTYKIFESGSQVFRYEFKEVDVNFGFIGCGSVTVLPNFILDFSDYPQIDTAVKVLKFIELMLFIVFLILKTRNLIRG